MPASMWRTRRSSHEYREGRIRSRLWGSQQVEGWHTTLVYVVVFILMVMMLFSRFGDRVVYKSGIIISYPHLVTSGDVFSVQIEGIKGNYRFVLNDDGPCSIVDKRFNRLNIAYDIRCSYAMRGNYGELRHIIRFTLYDTGCSADDNSHKCIVYESGEIEVLPAIAPLDVYSYLVGILDRVVAFSVLLLFLLPLFLMVPQEVKKLIAEWR